MSGAPGSIRPASEIVLYQPQQSTEQIGGLLEARRSGSRRLSPRRCSWS